ncbi:MAG: nickel-dependent lactate racemase [Ignisphaera sp.]
MKVFFPYGRKYIEIDLPHKTHVLYSKAPRGLNEEEVRRIIRNRLENPVDSSPLRVLALRSRLVTILITDKTRATPNRLLLEQILKVLDEVGIRRDSINIIVATGLHKPHRRDEIIELVGEVIAKEFNVYSHNSDDEEHMVYLGKTVYGTDVLVNKDVVESDLTIGIGLIEPHFFAGYSGGRKLILPGVSATKTVYQNHGYKMLSHPKADYGYLDGNPVHEDMIDAAKRVRSYKFIVHVLLDKEKRVFDVVAGDPFKAHEYGVKELDKYVKIEAPFEADLTIVTNGGYPLDRDLYQAVKGMVTASRVTKRGGVIIMLSECVDGVGHEHFRDLASVSKDPQKILEYIERNEPLRDQWEVQKLVQVLLKNKVIVVTRNISHSVLEEMNLIPSSAPEEAMEIACRLTPCEKIIAIPEGPYIIPFVEQAQ